MNEVVRHAWLISFLGATETARQNLLHKKDQWQRGHPAWNETEFVSAPTTSTRKDGRMRHHTSTQKGGSLQRRCPKQRRTHHRCPRRTIFFLCAILLCDDAACLCAGRSSVKPLSMERRRRRTTSGGGSNRYGTTCKGKMSTRLDGSQEDVGQDDPATPLPHASDVRIETGLNFSSMDRLKIIQTRLERTVFDAENGIEKAIVETLHSVGSSPSSLVMNENDDTPSFGIMDTSPTFSKISNMLALAGAATLSSWIVGEMLLNFEWFQAWRYFWPLVGAVFVFDGLYPHVGTVSPAANAIGGAIGNGTRRRWISPAPSQRQSLSSPSSSPSRTGTQNAASSPLSMQQYLPSQVFGSKSAGANTSNMTWLQWIAFVVGGAGLLVGGAYDAWMPIWETGPNVITSAGIGHDSAMLLLAAVLSMTASSSNDPNDAFNKKRVDTTAAALSGDGYDGTVDEFSFDPMDTKDQANVRDASAIITNRGIGIDNKRATILDSVDSDHRTQTFWLQVLLVTELYKLSESAIDEVVTKGLDLVT